MAADFVAEWQGQRTVMETNEVFVDEASMEAFVAKFGDASCGGDLSWHALKVSCLLARSDTNTQALLRSGGVAAALSVLRAEKAHATATHLEAALALLQNVAYSAEGVTSILHESGVYAVLHAMRTHHRAPAALHAHAADGTSFRTDALAGCSNFWSCPRSRAT